MGAIGTLLPLVVLFTFVGVAAYVGYQVYLWTNDLTDRGVRKMEKKNVVFTKDGMKVGVKEVSTEDYADKTQRAFVKAWNAGNESHAPPKKSPASRSASYTSSRPSPSRTASSTSAKARK